MTAWWCLHEREVQRKLNIGLISFRKKLNEAAGKQHLQLTAEIRTTKNNYLTPAKEERVQIVKNEKLPFLEMRMSWSPDGDV